MWIFCDFEIDPWKSLLEEGRLMRSISKRDLVTISRQLKSVEFNED
jgi:hypothetical protein